MSQTLKIDTSRGPKHGQSERQIMFFKVKEMLKKARQEKHDSIPTGYRRSLAEHDIGEKEITLHDRIALERHDYTVTRFERQQKAKRGVDADGPQNALQQRREFAVALKRCLKMQDTRLALTEQTLIPIHPQHQQRQRQNQQFEEGENFDCFVDRKNGWCIEESHGKTRPQRLHLQFCSGQLRNGKRVGVHVNFHIIWAMVVISVSWKEFQKINGGVDSTPVNTAHAAQHSLFTSAERISLALGSRIAHHLVRLISIFHLVRTCLTLCCSRTCFAPRAHHLPRSLFSTTTPQHAAQYIINFSKHSRSTSSAIKSHSGVKTCRVLEIRSKHSAQGMSPKGFDQRACDCLKDLEVNRSISVTWCTGKNLEKKITELRLPKKWRNLENLGRLASRILKYQRRRTTNRTCNSTTPWKSLQVEDGVTEEVDFTTENPESFGDWSCRREREVHNTLKPIEWKVWGRIHLTVRKLRGKPMHCFHLNRETWFSCSSITCSMRQVLATQEFHVESPTECVGEQQWQTEELQDAQYRFVESRREQVRLQEELSMKEVSNMQEIGEIERAQEFRVDEVSVQKSRENHETILSGSSPNLQQKQKQMNFMSDSGDFQDVESNCGGTLSHVPGQPAMIPSPGSMLSHDKRLRLDTWNQSGPRDCSQRIQLTTCMETDKQSLKQEGWRQVTQVKTDKIKAQFKCRHLRQSRWLRVLQCRWNYHGTTWSDSKSPQDTSL